MAKRSSEAPQSAVSMFQLALLLGLMRAAVGAQTRGRFTHGWDTSSQSTFADIRNADLWTDAQVADAVSKYRVISLEKCTGDGNGTFTEDAIYAAAVKIKRASPGTAVVFYLATDQQGAQCPTRWGAEFDKHPEWWLKDDAGTVLTPHVMDHTVAAARSWWASIPLNGTDGAGSFDGRPVSELIDGVLCDGAGWKAHAGIATARLEALEDGLFAMIAELQAKLTAANGGVAMANGISMYGGRNADPRTPTDRNVKALGFVDAIMNEHSAVFESVNAKNASLNVETVAQDLDAIERAAQLSNGSKAVFMQTWPGLYATTGFNDGTVYPPVANGGEPSPRNNGEWRDALRAHFGFAHALYLSVAQDNVWWMYAAYWYESHTGYLACPEDPDSCAAPPEWYADLDKPLGAPLGPRKLVAPYTWERKFEHASVRLDLNMPNASAVTFSTAADGA
jgi:hypothetical protein